jgi:hypothetical protein
MFPAFIEALYFSMVDRDTPSFSTTTFLSIPNKSDNTQNNRFANDAPILFLTTAMNSFILSMLYSPAAILETFPRLQFFRPSFLDLAEKSRFCRFSKRLFKNPVVFGTSSLNPRARDRNGNPASRP